MTSVQNLVSALLAGDTGALAQAISQVETRSPGFAELLSALFPLSGHAHVVGVAGAPGVGKSTLITALAPRLATAHAKVAVLAVDPTSVITGGALLGDRIRMGDLVLHDRIFMRSLATRGASGGLSQAVWDIVSILDAAGYDPILIETVGSGQSEVNIHTLAHTTVLVDAPGLGDSIQALKAGLLEVSDMVVINKSDLPGCTQAATRIRQTLRLASPSSQTTGATVASEVWEVPVLTSCATTGAGLDSLQNVLQHHRAHLQRTGKHQVLEQKRHQFMVDTLLTQAWQALLVDRISPQRRAQLLQAVQLRQKDPHAAAQELLDDLLLQPDEGDEVYSVL